jgi:hypothetical protein
VTASEAAAGTGARALPRVVAGSWIYRNLATWIGHPEKNRAWDLLARTRTALVAGGCTRATHPVAWESLAKAEGSDWFWWYGDDHHTPDKPLFDELFRAHLRGAYGAAGIPVPTALEFPIARMAREPEQHQRPLGSVRVTVDGQRTHFYEWYAAGRVSPGAGSAMHRKTGVVRDLFYGFDADRLMIRIDAVPSGFPPGSSVRLERGGRITQQIEIGPLDVPEPPIRRTTAPEGVLAGAECRIGAVLELAIPIAALDAGAGEEIELALQVLGPDGPIETLPGDDVLRLTIPGPGSESSLWSA